MFWGLLCFLHDFNRNLSPLRQKIRMQLWQSKWVISPEASRSMIEGWYQLLIWRLLLNLVLDGLQSPKLGPHAFLHLVDNFFEWVLSLIIELLLIDALWVALRWCHWIRSANRRYKSIVVLHSLALPVVKKYWVLIETWLIISQGMIFSTLDGIPSWVWLELLSLQCSKLSDGTSPPFSLSHCAMLN